MNPLVLERFYRFLTRRVQVSAWSGQRIVGERIEAVRPTTGRESTRATDEDRDGPGHRPGNAISESLQISIHAINRLVNHRMRNDLTAGYVVTDLGRVRVPIQKITDPIRALADDTLAAETVPLKR